MKVAIVHYHLKPGGVTRVIENAVAALQAKSIRTIVFGGVPYTGSALPYHDCIPELDYCIQATFTGQDLANKLIQKAKEHFGSLPDIWHIHNHSLGKNVAFMATIEALIEKGQKLLLQMHDFAEDGRPRNYAVLQESLKKTQHLISPYPLSDNVRYGVINSRDASYLKASGMPEEKLSILPNAVLTFGEATLEKDPLPDTAMRLLLYPTRGIRRKNMGEMLLLATLWDDENTVIASTLPPNNPQWLPIYDRWVQLAQELNLPAVFGVGLRDGTRFEDWIARSDCLLTTSIQEGFGLAYLEPWLFEKPLMGRNLHEITEDFEGIDLGHLYTKILIPMDLISGEIEAKVQSALETYYEQYSRPLPKDAVKRFFKAVCSDDCIDFGALDESLQIDVIKALVKSPELKESIKLPLNIPQRSIILRNKERVQKDYNLNSYGNLLCCEYQKLLSSDTNKNHPEDLSGEQVLNQFLSPEHFRFLRS